MKYKLTAADRRLVALLRRTQAMGANRALQVIAEASPETLKYLERAAEALAVLDRLPGVLAPAEPPAAGDPPEAEEQAAAEL